jgi:acetyl-CoA C-acetyltransferase/acetyl-CoA acyltransferase
MKGCVTTRAPEEGLAVLAGARTPFAKAFTALNDASAVELGRSALLGALARAALTPEHIDEVVFGNVASPADASNVARVIALRAGVPQGRPAHTVNRNCASGMEAVHTAWQIVREERADVIIAGGTESMSQVPLLWVPAMKEWLLNFRKARGWHKWSLIAGLRPRFFRPIPALELGLTDPTCGLNMGQTAELLAKEFGISRGEQDEFALRSHQRAVAAWKRGYFVDEVVSVPADGGLLHQDVGPREHQSLAALQKLPPIFDRAAGSVTAGNSCPITDGAVALVVTSARTARELGRQPLGYVRATAVVGCEPQRMGLGPVFAIHRLLSATGRTLNDFALFEINEAFAAQVLACVQALRSAEFCRRELGTSAPVGELDLERLNVNGGAIALGHPVGASGARLVLTLMRALRERGERHGLAALCVGGGQGMAMWVECPKNE